MPSLPSVPSLQNRNRLLIVAFLIHSTKLFGFFGAESLLPLMILL